MRPPNIRRLLDEIRSIHRFASTPHDSWADQVDGQRKSNARILADLVAWRIRKREIHRFYFLWGLDRRDAPPARNFLSRREFRKLRDMHNNRLVGEAGVSYVLLLEDKYLFSMYVASMGHPTPRVIALLDRDRITWLSPRRTATLDSLLEPDRTLDVFCKEVLGQRGLHSFRLEAAGGVLRINGEIAGTSDVANRLSTRALLQERVVQHPDLDVVYPHSVNTLRLITVRMDERARLFSIPGFRTGVSGSVVDNWSTGGILIPIDADTGVLRGSGRYKDGGTVTHHPDTGIRFDGFEIPHYREAVELATRIHQDVPEIHSVGWDLAITPQGPVMIEGNSRWLGDFRMGLDPGFTREFLRLFAGT